jgi:hypothetical protein
MDRWKYWSEMTWIGGNNPLLVRRGGRGAAGVVARTGTLLVSDHPVCGFEVGYAEIFLMPQPPLLTRRGLARPHNNCL